VSKLIFDVSQVCCLAVAMCAWEHWASEHCSIAHLVLWLSIIKGNFMCFDF